MRTVAPLQPSETRAILQARILGVPVARLYHPERASVAVPTSSRGCAGGVLPGLDPSTIGPLVRQARG